MSGRSHDIDKIQDYVALMFYFFYWLQDLKEGFKTINWFTCFIYSLPAYKPADRIRSCI